MRKHLPTLIAAAVTFLVSVAAVAGNNTFFTSIGDLIFPFTPPPAAGTPGTIDNMTIGATTPAAGTFTTINGSGNFTLAAIVGGATPFPITGQAPATATSAGGAVAIAGGIGGGTSGAGGATSLTGGAGTTNAVGGISSVIGGAGQGTGNGAAARLTGGASGTGATGAGGAATIAGGAAASTNGAGGAASVTGGVGIGTGNGGAASLVGGAAGATGVGGAVSITAGAPTAGVGSGVTITATAGAGSTNGGGSINLVQGAAVSTGIPGTVQVNGDAGLICPTYFYTGTPAATNQAFFLATRALYLVEVSEVHAVAAGGTSTLGIYHDTSTTAPAGGTDVLSADFNLNATANTVQVGSLSATVATKTFAAGDRLSIKFVNAIQSSTGVVVTACFAPQ
jgi:collagen type VII alpha